MNASSPSVRCSVVIATLDRLTSLGVVLDCLERQTRPPLEVLVAVAGDPTPVSAALQRRSQGSVPVRVVGCPEKSAAVQRNHAAAQAVGDVLAFLDDDIEFDESLFARVLDWFEREPPVRFGAISPRIAGLERPPPGRFTRWYYACQAGYLHADYGGRLFGPGINCLPVLAETGPDVLTVDWLPSTCLFLRADIFRRHQFPRFSGYSFAEDVHLTARVAREGPLLFLREPSFLHHSLPSEFKSDRAALTAGKLENSARVAREVLGLRGWSLWWRWQLHRLFLSAVTIGRRPAGWRQDIRGIWTAHP